jgi:hypothetical protein
MRVVCPYAGSVHPRTRSALDEQAPDVEYVDVGRSPVGYYELMRSLWRDAETFALIEHDVVIAPSALANLEACAGPWCSCPPSNRWEALAEAPIKLLWHVQHGCMASFLQCNKFGRELMLAQPDLCDAIPLSRQHWAGLDRVVAHPHQPGTSRPQRTRDAHPPPQRRRGLPQAQGSA